MYLAKESSSVAKEKYNPQDYLRKFQRSKIKLVNNPNKNVTVKEKNKKKLSCTEPN